MNWRFSWYLKRLPGKSPPHYLNLEPTNRCNLSCIWCVASSARPQGFLELALARRVLDQAASAGVREIRFFLAGEPLLHPKIHELVSMAKIRKLRTVIHSNAMLLTREKSEALISAGLDEISFSVNGLTHEEISQNQPGAELDVMVSHIRDFLTQTRDTSSLHPLVILQIIQHPTELRKPLDWDRIRALFGEPGPDRILRLAPHSWAGQLSGDAAAARGTRYHPCQPLWQGMSVAWDGRVFLCCGDLNGRVVIGDLRQERLMDVWNGQRLNGIRQHVVKNDRSALALCSGCDALWWQRHPLSHDVRRACWRVLGGVLHKTKGLLRRRIQ